MLHRQTALLQVNQLSSQSVSRSTCSAQTQITLLSCWFVGQANLIITISQYISSYHVTKMGPSPPPSPPQSPPFQEPQRRGYGKLQVGRKLEMTSPTTVAIAAIAFILLALLLRLILHAL